MVACNIISVEEPYVGNMPLFKVILDHTAWALKTSNTVPSDARKSAISLEGSEPGSISVLSKLKFKPIL